MINKMVLTAKKSLLLVLTTLALTSMALTNATTAQELSPAHLALAQRYVQLTDKSQIYERALIETGISTMRTILSQNPEITDQVSAAIGEIIKQYADRKGELFEEFARIYALRFTQEELTEIVAFYESDIGQKLARENVNANQDLKAVMTIFKRNLNTEFFAKVRVALREQGIDL